MPASRTCPICKRPVGEGEAELRFRPFCSKRCADVDLGRWLKGGYAIPATQAEDDDGDGPSGESPDDEAPQVRH